MKPDWKDAPEWANWLAMDGDRMWYWYEDEPCIRNIDDTWIAQKGKYEAVHFNIPNPHDSLDARPAYPDQ